MNKNSFLILDWLRYAKLIRGRETRVVNYRNYFARPRAAAIGDQSFGEASNEELLAPLSWLWKRSYVICKPVNENTFTLKLSDKGHLMLSQMEAVMT